jgi:hypothetical protein
MQEAATDLPGGRMLGALPASPRGPATRPKPLDVASGYDIVASWIEDRPPDDRTS